MDKEKIVDHFTKIYKTNYWNGIESKSGTGSDLIATATLIPHLIDLINNLEVKTMIDAPCGDFHWMKEVVDHLNVEEYFGMDVVPEMVAGLVEKYTNLESTPKRTFSQIDVVHDILPKCGVIFSRDCLVHFSYETAKQIMRNFIASGSEYVLMTTFLSEDRPYGDILDGQWRAINFQLKPFNFPEPERVIIEGCMEDHYRWTDKSLGLWKLDTLKGFLDVVSE